MVNINDFDNKYVELMSLKIKKGFKTLYAVITLKNISGSYFVIKCNGIEIKYKTLEEAISKFNQLE